jgi:methionine aminopeptidase
LLIVIVLRRGSQIKQVRKRGQVAARATVGYHAVPVRSTKTNELFCFVENDTQKMVRKKEKKNYEQQAPRRARVPVIDFCCLIAHTDSFILPYNSW